MVVVKFSTAQYHQAALVFYSLLSRLFLCLSLFPEGDLQGDFLLLLLSDRATPGDFGSAPCAAGSTSWAISVSGAEATPSPAVWATATAAADAVVATPAAAAVAVAAEATAPITAESSLAAAALPAPICPSRGAAFSACDAVDSGECMAEEAVGANKGWGEDAAAAAADDDEDEEDEDEEDDEAEPAGEALLAVLRLRPPV